MLDLGAWIYFRFFGFYFNNCLLFVSIMFFNNLINDFIQETFKKQLSLFSNVSIDYFELVFIKINSFLRQGACMAHFCFLD